MPPKVAEEAGLLLDPATLQAALGPSLTPHDRDASKMLQELIATPALAGIIDSAYRLYFSPDPTPLMPGLKVAVGNLPTKLVSAIGTEIIDIAETITGLLAHPDVGNAIVEGLHEISDDDLVVLRDYVLGWPAMHLGLREVLATLRDDPQAMQLSAFAGFLTRFTASFSTAERQMLLGFFIARARAKPSFLESARASTRMRVGLVLCEVARRDLFRVELETESWKTALVAAGVAPENWSLWLGGPEA